jgi:hypothetical protein
MVQKQLVMVSLAFANFLQTLLFWGMLWSFLGFMLLQSHGLDTAAASCCFYISLP